VPLWKTILLRSAGFGVGFALAVCAVVGTWAWHSNRPKPIKPWDKGAVTAEYQDVRTRGEQNNVSFNYVLQNNTDVDYRIESDAAIEIAATLKDQKTLSQFSHEIKTVYPIFVPARRRVQCWLTIPYHYPAKEKDNDDSVERKQYRDELAKYVTDNLTNLSGFVLFDTSNRYEIDFPGGWDKGANGK
jgi:hypothetical protein